MGGLLHPATPQGPEVSGIHTERGGSDGIRVFHSLSAAPRVPGVSGIRTARGGEGAVHLLPPTTQNEPSVSEIRIATSGGGGGEEV